MLQLLDRPAPHGFRTLQLSVKWERRGHSFRESLEAFFSSPKPVVSGHQPNYFRDTYVGPYWPHSAFVASLLWHVALISVLALPIWRFPSSRAKLALVQIEVTWNQPAADLPPLTHSGALARHSAPGEHSKRLARRGADAFHPRQTIVSMARRPTHPRQTLIQPNAPPRPPKIMAQIPNIVEWPQSTGAIRLRLQLVPSATRPHRPRLMSRRAGTPPAPELRNQERTPGLLNFAASPVVNPAPKLPVPPSAAPRIVGQEKPPDASAPEIGSGAKIDSGPLQLNLTASDQNLPRPKLPGGSSASPKFIRKRTADAGPAPDLALTTNANDTGRRIIALSANPAPPAANVNVPWGNLSARISISPEGRRPGIPGGSPNGTIGTTGGAVGGPGSIGGTGGTRAGPGGGSGGIGPADVSITGGNPKTASTVSGSPSNVAGTSTRARTPPSATTASPRPEPERGNSARLPSTIGKEGIDAGSTAEQILGVDRVYTIYVNMPNLTSATGSWVLNFAELQTGETPNQASGEVSSPVPVRKVDPKYPPTLVNAHIEGDVVLYAIIRRDGAVDSIQLLKGIDPQLDQNAMEAFARWKFRPATRNGAPVELETLVHIPFRASPGY